MIKVAIAIALLLGLVCGRFTPEKPTDVMVQEVGEDQFANFIVNHGKVYSGTEEHNRRHQIFNKNLELAKQHAKENPLATYGVTQFMDLSPEEFRSMYLMSNFTVPTQKERLNWEVKEEKNFGTTDNIFDWSQRGKTTGVYNQGQCGSCWAFSVTEQLESMWAIAGHSLTNLAMQQLVDCEHCSHGCSGGAPACAWPYIQRTGGLDSLSSYPYVAHNEACHFSPNNIAAKIRSWGYVTTNRNEGQMKQYLLNVGPISVCVDASQWQYYRNGIVTNCGRSIDHCVQITGWDYSYNAWVVRNSWGTGWGVGGYIAIAAGGDVCAIAEVPTSAEI